MFPVFSAGTGSVSPGGDAVGARPRPGTLAIHGHGRMAEAVSAKLLSSFDQHRSRNERFSEGTPCVMVCTSPESSDTIQP